ncbi:MAG: hypothetical protein IT320_02915 [Anaerolineae bacterium]|nr:hypothetical protein [Anaerolineae bacterium]
MNTPLPFEDFLAQTRAARFADYAQRPGVQVADEASFSAMQQHILRRYAGLRAIRTIFVDSNVFDCIIEMEVQIPAPADADGCPDGSIPMRRITLEELTRFQTLGDFLGKGAGSYPR